MELTTEAWVALGAIGTTVAGAVAYLVKPGLDANRKRQEELERHSAELSELQKQYIKTATESSQLNATTNAKQAADLAAQSAHLHLVATAIASVSSKTDMFHEALQKFVLLGRLFIRQVPDKGDQESAQKHLDEIVAILGHKR